jgi:hypothetical protein
MYDSLIIAALEAASIYDDDLSHHLENQLRRNSVLDMDCPLDLSSLCHASDISNPFIQ